MHSESHIPVQGPRDHIAGDRQFALHGNPEGIKHSMVCPEPSKSNKSKDCYFIDDCHSKVNWDKVKVVKEDFFAKLKAMKHKDAAVEVKALIEAAHKIFLEAGMPDNRIDHILEKWVKAARPEALAPSNDKASGEQQDCFFDKECHSKVDWEKVAKIKEGLAKRYRVMTTDRASIEKTMTAVYQMLAEAGVPDDHVHYIASKWMNDQNSPAAKRKSVFV